MALLLVSSALFPSAQQAFAADVTIGNGQDFHVPADCWKELLIRDAKGQKDRVTMLSGALIEPLRAQRNAVGALLIRRHALATLS